ncbi:DapH/DapD/GlmU-related protein [Sphingopyxis sp.]|uniref:acyltransferase n=1 Tax=Sphingopyxis sp. TaxID=1908224 RepID=UPI002611B466|nr:acyltransferase [Sphingopyxis sp.]MCW0196977.1 acyltransferase [Sphingopyxis sp.]
MLRSIVTGPPFSWLSGGLDLFDHYWTAWRTYCRIRAWFPGSRELSFSLSTKFKYRENIRIGDHVRIGPGVIVGAHAPVVMEDYVRISQYATIETAGLDLNQPLPYPHVSRPIVLKRGAWIGAGAMVLGGVTVGENAVIGAGVIVTRDVPPGAILVGQAPRQLDRRVGG